MDEDYVAIDGRKVVPLKVDKTCTEISKFMTKTDTFKFHVSDGKIDYGVFYSCHHSPADAYEHYLRSVTRYKTSVGLTIERRTSTFKSTLSFIYCILDTGDIFTTDTSNIYKSYQEWLFGKPTFIVKNDILPLPLTHSQTPPIHSSHQQQQQQQLPQVQHSASVINKRETSSNHCTCTIEYIATVMRIPVDDLNDNLIKVHKSQCTINNGKGKTECDCDCSH